MSEAMLVDKTAINCFLEEQLTAISFQELPEHTLACPHCRLPVKYPVIARDRDIKDFEMIMESAYRVMDKFDIKGNLLAEMRVDIELELLRRKTLAVENRDG